MPTSANTIDECSTQDDSSLQDNPGNTGQALGVPTIRCCHCGRSLKAKILEFMGRSMTVADEECTCEGALRAKREQALEQEKQKRKEYETRLAKTGIEPRFYGVKLDDCPFCDVVKAIDYKAGQGLCVKGPVGSGKSRLVSALAQWLLGNGGDPRKLATPELITLIRDSFSKDESEYDTINRYIGADYLILDDFDKASGSEWEMRTLYQIINGRYGLLRPTVITTHYGYSDLLKRLARKGEVQSAEEIVSRIKETSVLIALPEMNWRLK